MNHFTVRAMHAQTKALGARDTKGLTSTTTNRLDCMPIVQIDHGQLWTTSTDIAEKFGRAHKSVLRSIDGLIKDCTINGQDFVPVEYSDAKGEARRAFRLNKRAALIAMPFIGGKKSKEGQKILVDAFLKMERELMRIATQRHDPVWLTEREYVKECRHDETDAILAFIKYAMTQGSSGGSRMYYTNFSRMVNKALFDVTNAGDEFRNQLTATQLRNLATAERIILRAIVDGMAKQMFYKAIFQLAKRKVEAFAESIGRTLPGNDRLLLEVA